MEEAYPAKRAASTSVQDRRQVKAGIADVAAVLTDLQREAAFLGAMATHERRGLEKRMTSLRERIAALEQRLDSAIEDLPEHLRGHGRVTDLQR